jgi:hypothetical protein
MPSASWALLMLAASLSARGATATAVEVSLTLMTDESDSARLDGVALAVALDCAATVKNTTLTVVWRRTDGVGDSVAQRGVVCAAAAAPARTMLQRFAALRRCVVLTSRRRCVLRTRLRAGGRRALSQDDLPHDTTPLLGRWRTTTSLTKPHLRSGTGAQRDLPHETPHSALALAHNDLPHGTTSALPCS